MRARLAAAVLLLCGVSATAALSVAGTDVQEKAADTTGCPPGVPVADCKVNPCDSHPCGDEEKCTPDYCGGCGHTCTSPPGTCVSNLDCGGDDFVCQPAGDAEGGCLPHNVCVPKATEGEKCTGYVRWECDMRVCTQGLRCVSDPAGAENAGGVCRTPPKGCTQGCGGSRGLKCPASRSAPLACVAFPSAPCSLAGDDEACVGCCVPDLCTAETCAPWQVCKMDEEGAAVCVPKETKPAPCEDKAPCGGIAGNRCDAGFACRDDPNDACDPTSGGVDCAGCCEPVACCLAFPTCPAGTTATRDPCTADEYESGVCSKATMCCSTIVCRRNKACERDGDCAKDEFCRQAVGSNGVSPCLGERVCVKKVGVGATCGGFTLPCFQERCQDGLVCRPSDPTGDAPGTCAAPVCSGKARCGGITGASCNSHSHVCIDDPDDYCDPARGGADCGGCCVFDVCQRIQCKAQDVCRINSRGQAECVRPLKHKCDGDGDCAKGEFCGQGIGGRDGCPQERVCSKKVAKGGKCGLFSAPVCERRCGDGLTCDKGICVEGEAVCKGRSMCGGIAGIQCTNDMVCIANPDDNCDPALGGADCGGCCVPDACRRTECKPGGACTLDQRGRAVCVPQEVRRPASCEGKTPCGGILGLECKPGYVCRDDPDDVCDPATGADCGGCCERDQACCDGVPTCPAGTTVTREPCTADEYESGVCVKETMCCSTIVCRQNKACERDRDCAKDEFCRAAVGTTAKLPCLDEQRVCVKKVGVGAKCGGFTLPCFHERCRDDLLCERSDPTGDAPGTCVEHVCRGKARCGGGAGTPCGGGEVCIDDPDDLCDPKWGGDCRSCCVRDACRSARCKEGHACMLDKRGRAECVLKSASCEGKTPCGGFLGRGCDDGYACKDDPDDECDPANGGADCGGCCQRCDARACAMPLCREGSELFTPHGSCCPQCREKPQRLCTEEARQCPDGSWVSRDPARDCQFQRCPPGRGPDCALVDCAEDPECPEGEVAFTPAYECCPRCYKDACVVDATTLLSVGASTDTAGCLSCKCVSAGSLKCAKRVGGDCGASCLVNGVQHAAGASWKPDRCGNVCSCRGGVPMCSKRACADACAAVSCLVGHACVLNADGEAGCELAVDKSMRPRVSSCVLDDGRVFEEGDTFRVACNACVCRGGSAACDERSCEDGVCALPDGRLMEAGESAKLDGCNTCVCGPDGGAGAACTRMYCEPRCTVAQPGLSTPLLPSTREECCARAAAEADLVTFGALRCRAAAEKLAEAEARERCHPVRGGVANAAECCARFRLRCPHERFDCFSPVEQEEESSTPADAAYRQLRRAFCCRWHGLSCAEPCATDAGRMTKRQRAACCVTHGTGCEPQSLAVARATDAAAEAALVNNGRAVLGRVSLRGNVVEAQRNPKRLLARFRLATLRSVPGVRPADVRVSAIGVLLPGGGVPDERARAAWGVYTPTSWNEELFEEEARMLGGAEATRGSAAVLEGATTGETAVEQDVAVAEEGVFVEFAFVGATPREAAEAFAKQVMSGALAGGHAAATALPVQPMGSGVEWRAASHPRHPRVSDGLRPALDDDDNTMTVVVVGAAGGLSVLLAAAAAGGILYLRRSRACANGGAGGGVEMAHRVSVSSAGASTEDAAERALPADVEKVVEGVVVAEVLSPSHSAGTKEVPYTGL